MERIARDRLNAAIQDLADKFYAELGINTDARLREFARAVAMVATTAAFGLDPNPESAVERMVAS